MSTDEHDETGNDRAGRRPTDRVGVSETASEKAETAPLSTISLVEQVLAIGRDCAAHLPDEIRLIDHADFLYDERGLPK